MSTTQVPAEPAGVLVYAAALLGGHSERVYLIAANDGQLLKYWRDFGDTHPDSANLVATLRRMLQEERETDPDGAPALRLINLSRQPHHALFEQLLDAVLRHQGWSGCNGCELLAESSCPIRRNREILLARGDRSPRLRLGEVIRLAAANDMHLPMRQVLVLIVNMLLGDKIGQRLLTCRTARPRASKEACDATNLFDNALGINLRPKDRGQYHVFTALETFGLGRETNNAIDTLLIDRLPAESHARLVADDRYYGAVLFERWRRLYRRSDLDDAFDDFRAALESQRRRLFFTLPSVDYGLSNALDPWKLTVFEHGGVYLAFQAGLEQGDAMAMRIAAQLLRGLNRTFTGRMCEDADALWLAAPAANSSEQLGRVLECEPLPFGAPRMTLCRVTFDAEGLHGRPRLTVRGRDGEIVAKLELRPLMFEYLMWVANGSLPASFSRQCFEELRHFRLGLTGKLRDLDLIDPNDLNQMALVRLSYRGTLQQERLQASVGGAP